MGVPYQGRFTCPNLGNADALDATSCTTGPLPEGINVQACAISPDNAAWVAGNSIPPGAVVTCEVAGVPANVKKTTTTTGTTGTTGDRELSNNTTSKEITVGGIPDVVIDLSGVPSTGTVGYLYKGTCTNRGSADMADTSCIATGLPSGITQGPGSCTIVSPANPAPTSWTSPSAIPEAATVTCPVEGRATQIGATDVSGKGGESTANKEVTINATPVATPVPSLGGLGLLLLSGAVVGSMGAMRRRKST